jgi:hypothetical protein
MLGDTGQVDGDNPDAHQGIGLFYLAKTTLIGNTRQINAFINSDLREDVLGQQSAEQPRPATEVKE